MRNNLRFLLDTGAEISVLPHKMFKNTSNKNDLILSAANGAIINTFGHRELLIDITRFKKKIFFQFYYSCG